MTRRRYTDEQIAYAARQAESGTTVAEICRKMRVSQQTFHTCRRKFAGMGVSELRELRQLREDNKKLKQLVADLSLDKHMLQEVLSKRRWAWSNRSSLTASIVTSLSRLHCSRHIDD